MMQLNQNASQKIRTFCPLGDHEKVISKMYYQDKETPVIKIKKEDSFVL
jgi:hypothetical protein